MQRHPFHRQRNYVDSPDLRTYLQPNKPILSFVPQRPQCRADMLGDRELLTIDRDLPISSP